MPAYSPALLVARRRRHMHMHTCNVDLRGRVRQPQHRVVAVAAAKNALHVGSVGAGVSARRMTSGRHGWCVLAAARQAASASSALQARDLQNRKRYYATNEALRLFHFRQRRGEPCLQEGCRGGNIPERVSVTWGASSGFVAWSGAEHKQTFWIRRQHTKQQPFSPTTPVPL